MSERTNFRAVNEESSEFEVAVFDRIVPWAQQADKKTLNLGYKNKHYFQNIQSFWLDLLSYWVLTVAISGDFCFVFVKSSDTSYDDFKISEMFPKLVKMACCDSNYSLR